MYCMEWSKVQKWLIFFAGILCAIVIADALSNIIVNVIGITGWEKFVISFILYAGLFFAILYLLEKLFHIEFFGFGRE
jgi:hypothetical protein